MNKLDGYKTLVGAALMGIAFLGWDKYITPVEFADAINNAIALAGILMAVYGRLVATKIYLKDK